MLRNSTIPYKDYRLPENRREHFMDLYEFQLHNRSHPGGVYFIMPYLAYEFGWDMEDKLWFAFLNGNTQNPVTSLTIMREFPKLPASQEELELMQEWFNSMWSKLEFDIDRRYQKKDLIKSIQRYKSLAEEYGSQHSLLTGTFKDLWKRVRTQFYTFGRLSAFSYLEYVRIMGAGDACDTLFLRDLSGSKSHRNGLCKLLGHDELDWHDSNPLGFAGKYTEEQFRWLEHEGEVLLQESKERFAEKPYFRDVGYFTIESTLCTFKSHYRENRRYPGVYMDMMYNRIKRAEHFRPEEDFSIFWQCRQDCLPKYLRLEDNPDDPGEVPIKQNHFRETGQVPVLGKMFPGKYYDDGRWRAGRKEKY